MKRKYKVITSVLSVLLVFTSNRGSQSGQSNQAPQARVQPSPVPLWPYRWSAAKRVAGRYVFYDPSTEEYVLAYPEKLRPLPSFKGIPENY
jgi:hypothetical protein